MLGVFLWDTFDLGKEVAQTGANKKPSQYERAFCLERIILSLGHKVQADAGAGPVRAKHTTLCQVGKYILI